MQLKQCHKNWERKIEIAELEARKARAILKKHGGWMEASNGGNNAEFN
jgi:hypothetical protein